MDSVVRGHNALRDIWTPVAGQLACSKETNNAVDRCAVKQEPTPGNFEAGEPW